MGIYEKLSGECVSEYSLPYPQRRSLIPPLFPFAYFFFIPHSVVVSLGGIVRRCYYVHGSLESEGLGLVTLCLWLLVVGWTYSVTRISCLWFLVADHDWIYLVVICGYSCLWPAVTRRGHLMSVSNGATYGCFR